MIFVTGLTGLVGSGLMASLLQNNPSLLCEVVALCRESSDISHISPYCRIERGSSYDEKRLDDICSKYCFDTMVHISNKAQLVQFSKLAVKHRFRRVIMVSSTYACSRAHPDNLQVRIENESANILSNAHIEYIFLRPTSIFGLRPDGIADRNVSVFRKYIRKLPLFPLFKTGRATVRPLWGKDVGQALEICLSHFGQLKNSRLICSGDRTRHFKELIQEIARVDQRHVRFLYFPAWIARFFSRALYYISFKKKDLREPIDRLLEDRAFDTSLELIQLGYEPTDLGVALETYQISF